MSYQLPVRHHYNTRSTSRSGSDSSGSGQDELSSHPFRSSTAAATSKRRKTANTNTTPAPISVSREETSAAAASLDSQNNTATKGETPFEHAAWIAVSLTLHLLVGVLACDHFALFADKSWWSSFFVRLAVWNASGLVSGLVWMKPHPAYFGVFMLSLVFHGLIAYRWISALSC
jgi:hypothetical protein